MKKFSVISYTEYVCPCCGMKKVSEVRDEGDMYCSKNHNPKTMKKKLKTASLLPLISAQPVFAEP